MSKDTPFFKFDALEWLGGSIQQCSVAEKGLFIDICALYWKEYKPVVIDNKFKVRYRNLEGTLSNLIGTLSDLDLIQVCEAGITIKFLDEQMEKRHQWLEKCSKAGKKSAGVKGTSSNKKEESRKKKVDNRKKKVEIEKVAYAECVYMTTEQYESLLKYAGSESDRDWCINKLNAFKKSKSKKYDCDYSAMHSWVLSSMKKEQGGASPAQNVIKMPTQAEYEAGDDVIRHADGSYDLPF